MRITGLSIDGFGVFHDEEVTDIPAGLSLFLGDNEAGKSTMLAFVHTVLFGYPDRRSNEKEYPALQGGQPGGRLLVHSDEAGPLVLERRPGRRGGPLIITATDGEASPAGEATLSRLLGGVSRSLYRKLYAFSLNELEHFESLAEESVRDVIYGASLGATTVSLPEVRRRLESRKEELFKPSGSRPEINALLKELEDVRGALREARKSANEYQEATAQLRELDERIGSVKTTLHDRREQNERVKAHIRLWDDWSALQDAENRLAALPERVDSFPEDGLSRLAKWAGKIETGTATLRQLDKELTEKRERLERLAFDANLVEREADIRALMRGLGTYEQAMVDLPREQERCQSLARQAREVVTEFGSGRDEAWVLAMDRSTAARRQVEVHAESLRLAQSKLDQAATAASEQEERRDSAAEAVTRARDKVKELEAGLGEEVPPETLAALRDRRAQFLDVLRDLPRVEQQRAAAGEDLAGALQDISPEWTPLTLQAFDASLTARQRVADGDTRLTEAAAAVRETASALAQARQALGEADAAVRAKSAAIEESMGAAAQEAGQGAGEAAQKAGLDSRAAAQENGEDASEVAQEAGEAAGEEVGEGVREVAQQSGEEAGEVAEAAAAAEVGAAAAAEVGPAAGDAGEQIMAAATSPGVTLETLRERRSWIRALRQAVLQHEAKAGELRARREALQAVATRNREDQRAAGSRLERRLTGLAAGLAGLAVVVGAGLWITVGPVSGVVAGAGLALLALLAGVLLLIVRSAALSPSPHPAALADDDQATAALEQEVRARVAEIDALEQRLGIRGDVTLARVDALEDENDTHIQRAENRMRLQRELEELRAQRQRREEACQAATAGLEAAKTRQQVEEEAWRTLVRSLQLPDGTAPRTAAEVFAKAETARGLARQMAEYDGRMAEMRGTRDEYLELMQGVPALAPTVDRGDAEALRLALTEFLAEAGRLEEQRRQLAEAGKAADHAAEELAVAEKKREEAAAEQDSARAAQNESLSAWTAWLIERDMPESWSPDMVLRLLDRAARLTELVAVRDEATSQIERLQVDRDAYRRRIQQLSAELGRPAPPPDKLVAEVHALEAELGENLEKRARSHALADEIPAVEARRASCRESLQALKGRVRELFVQGNAADEETFRRRGRLYEERCALLETITELGERVLKVAPQTELETLRTELADWNLPGLTVAEEEAREQVAELETSLEELQQERTRRDEFRRRLLDEDSIARLRAQEESLLERFRELSADWARHAAALHLLSAAKDRFEKSHQPEVIQRAGTCFRHITGGRYQRLFAPHGEQTIEVIDDRGRRVTLDQLSRGTAEQLYLAIRFGYIASQDGNRESLPLLMDDVMVNFDPRRAAEAASGILEMAQTHQVLFFTCHPHTVEVFQEHREHVPVFELADGAISLRL